MACGGSNAHTGLGMTGSEATNDWTTYPNNSCDRGPQTNNYLWGMGYVSEWQDNFNVPMFGGSAGAQFRQVCADCAGTPATDFYVDTTDTNYGIPQGSPGYGEKYLYKGYVSGATAISDNSCCCYVGGCMDASACNYDPTACMQQGTCVAREAASRWYCNDCSSDAQQIPGTGGIGGCIEVTDSCAFLPSNLYLYPNQSACEQSQCHQSWDGLSCSID